MVILADIALFTRDGGIFLARWGHYISGVTWIGLLYYFNVVQGPAFAQFEAGSRTEATAKLVPRALWWFRWAAVSTVLFGLLILGFQKQFNGDYMKSPAGISISTGILLGLIMFANVWGVIWRNQKIVIANAQGNPIPGSDPAASARKAFLASRTNTLFSIPMLFFMAFTSHLALAGTGKLFKALPSGSARGIYWLVVVVVVALLELNGLGVFGGTATGGTKQYLEKHRDTIISGFVLAAVLYLVFQLSFGA